MQVVATTGPEAQNSGPELAIDVATASLLGVFAGLLFLGYFDTSFPYEAFAVIPLVLALAVLFWGHLRADRRARTQLGSSDP